MVYHRSGSGVVVGAMTAVAVAVIRLPLLLYSVSFQLNSNVYFIIRKGWPCIVALSSLSVVVLVGVGVGRSFVRWFSLSSSRLIDFEMWATSHKSSKARNGLYGWQWWCRRQLAICGGNHKYLYFNLCGHVAWLYVFDTNTPNIYGWSFSRKT